MDEVFVPLLYLYLTSFFYSSMDLDGVFSFFITFLLLNKINVRGRFGSLREIFLLPKVQSWYL